MENTQTERIDTERHKGGRPPKSEEECRNRRFQVGFTESELMIVDNKAEKAGKRRPNYLHDAALSANVKPHITDEQVLMVRDLAGMGNNLNQIARRANQGGRVAIRDKAQQTVGRIAELVKRILRGGDLSKPDEPTAV